jgi:hypothetical protein
LKKLTETRTFRANMALLVVDAAVLYFWPFIEQAGVDAVAFAFVGFLKTCINLYLRTVTSQPVK